MRPFSVVILAAGESSRLGRPKQLVEIDGVPLIRRAIAVAFAAEPMEVIVVLGAHAEEVGAAVAASSHEFGFVVKSGGQDAAASSVRRTPRLRALVNEKWQEGMGSSIRAGVEALNPSSEAVVLMLCDQLHVNGDLLRTLVEKLSDEVEIAAAEYDGLAGVPSALRRSVIPELLKLEGDLGARNILRDPRRNVVLVPFESAGIDIDTEADIDAARGA
jgi:molybdenum cofactor cytidylyltransferase